MLKAKLTLVLVTVIALCSCNDSNDDEYQVIELDVPQASSEIYRQANTPEETLNRIKNNLLYPANHYYFNGGVTDVVMGVPETVSPVADSAESSTSYSKTNTIEAGIDEADKVKYDGEYLYILVEPYYAYPQIDAIAIAPETTSPGDEKSYIRIMQTLPGNETKEVNKIISPAQYSFQSMYASTDQLHVLANQYQYASNDDRWGIENYPAQQSFHVVSFDTSDKASVTKANTIEVEGYLLDSRKIDNKLYVVSLYSSYQSELPFYSPSTEEQYQENQNYVDQLATEQLLPMIRVNNDKGQLLTQPDQCYIPNDSSNSSAQGSIVNITVFDLEQPGNFKSTCVNGYYHDFYMSKNSIYLTSSQWLSDTNATNTILQQFILNEDGAEYTATGVVPGYLGQGSKFRINEHNNLIRVVTSTRMEDSNDWLDHQLFILQSNANTKQLEPIAQLPNTQLSKEIGKPNEDIFAVRFFADKLYIVTFERTDPLYVIDLANPSQPYIAGELSIPGFSTYLHPLSDGYLFGLGQAGDGRDGVKLGLFDIRNLASPKQLATTTVGQRYSHSLAEYDHHAISFLKMADSTYRFSLPISVYLEQANPQDSAWDHNGMYLFAIDLQSDNSPLEHVGIIKSAQQTSEQQYPSHYGAERSVITKDSIYYISGPYVWASDWLTPELAVGPQ